MRTDAFDFPLPHDLIAQVPAPERDASRLLVLNRTSRQVEHRTFRDLPALLRPDDTLVLNQSKVIPARLRARKAGSSTPIEIFLLHENSPADWWALLKPGKRARPGTRLELLTPPAQPHPGLVATVVDKDPTGRYRLQFEGTDNLRRELDRLGEIPLPPYIQRPAGSSAAIDRDRYQTVFARDPGSVAAPTAGLHFTPALLETLRLQGVGTAFVTLHVGLGTFAPVKTDHIEEHRMHREPFDLPPETVESIAQCRQRGGRVVAVGTTALRVLETVAAQNDGRLLPGPGWSELFVHPPYRFAVVDALLTNFHLPRSTLLMLVSAFADPGGTSGRDLVLAAYAEAVRERYRFFSYGDAMLIL